MLLAGGVWLSLAAYVVVFLPGLLPWLRVVSHAAPVGYLGNRGDEDLVPWILGWVAHALATQPLHLFDVPINYPAPGQLAGIEHFLSTQVLFGPLFWLTGNAVFAASLVTMLTYPLGALAMERLLVALECARPVAWVGGLLFATGPLQVPGNLLMLKCPTLYLPLVSLMLVRLRARPAADRAAALALALGMALLSSYYMAVLVLMTAAVWIVFDLVGPADGTDRPRFLLSVLGASFAALIVFIAVSVPYLVRPEALGGMLAAEPALVQTFGNALFSQMAINTTGWMLLTLAAAGVFALGDRAASTRRLAAIGLTLTLLAQLLMAGPRLELGPWSIPGPFAVLRATPARFFRYPFRFVAVLGFGLALLASGGLEVLWRRLGRTWGGIGLAAVAATVVVTRIAHLSGSEFEEFPGQSNPIYERVGEVAHARDPGPLLELPLVPPAWDKFGGKGTEVDAMLGSLRNGLPLVTGYTAYTPPHRELVLRNIQRLPQAQALADIVDMSHARWVLLRPADEWTAPNVRVALLGLDGLTHALELDGWDLLRIERTPQHPEWFAAIAAGGQPGRSVLGTPLAPIAEAAARGVVEGVVPPAMIAGRPVPFRLRIRNLGSTTWPSVLPPGANSSHAVRLRVSWWLASVRHELAAATAIDGMPIFHDLSPGESYEQMVWVAVPKTPRLYDFEIAVEQVDGARFAQPGNQPLHGRVTVVPP
jgi:hypothetical protein